jgi:hypothetical protein
MRLQAHQRLAQSGPLIALVRDLGAALFAGLQRFF